mmetsp:Transcript_19594/g.27568  ORF Transcript_19594/g.27568 Transcript_19594/m.27568 type:complete len:121 (-) Transcript_19594:400-762(-)
MGEKKILVFLMSNGVSDSRQSSNQRRAHTILNAKKVPYMEVDGMDPDQIERRNELFKVSGKRGQYPQFFFLYEDSTASYIGGYEKLSELNDSSNFSYSILAANPNIETWEKVFEDVVEFF